MNIKKTLRKHHWNNNETPRKKREIATKEQAITKEILKKHEGNTKEISRKHKGNVNEI